MTINIDSELIENYSCNYCKDTGYTIIRAGFDTFDFEPCHCEMGKKIISNEIKNNFNS